jgi:signal transduction histidine kinase
VDAFTAELRHAVSDASTAVQPAARLSQSHELLFRELASLVAANFQNAIASLEQEDIHRKERLRYALLLLGAAVVLSIACAVKTTQTANQAIRRARWHAKELSRLSGHVLETQESVVRRLSRELHDEFGQSLSAIEANLAAITPATAEQASRIEDCMLLIQDAIGNVRELSQLLRPSILDDFGLSPGLRWLAESFQQRTGIEVAARIEYDARLPDESETHLFRIAQEAMTNVARHSGAKRVELTLSEQNGRVVLNVSDNGRGLSERNGRGGFGMMGMRERMRAAGGELYVHSTPQGLTIVAEVPIEQFAKQADPASISR